MTHRTEKPSQHESSTDTLISALDAIAKQLEETDYAASLALLEAAQRLGKLESDLHFSRMALEAASKQINDRDDKIEKLKKQKPTKTLRDEFAMAVLNGLASDAEFNDNAKGYAETSYKLADAMMEARK